MFVLLSAADLRQLCRGFLLLMIIILVGTLAAEKQLYYLTQNQEYTRTITFRQQGDNSYRLVVLGYDYIVRSVYRVGTLTTDESGISIAIANVHATVPRAYQWDARPFFTIVESKYNALERLVIKSSGEIRERGLIWWQDWNGQ